MSYEYQKEKPILLTDKGSRDFIHNRGLVLSKLKLAGAVRVAEGMKDFTGGDSWFYLACFDRMEEIGDIRQITCKEKVAGQDQVYVSVRDL